jgi:hypothetical protein
VGGVHYENSGLLTLLQMWTALEPAIRKHNAQVLVGQQQAFIEPWIIVASNRYRSGAGDEPT